MPNWTRIALLCAAAVVLSCGFRPWVGAVAGAFAPADISQNVAAARMFAQRQDPYTPAFRQVHAEATGRTIDGAYPYFPHPPFSLVLALPLGRVDYRAGVALWFAVTLGLLVILAAVVREALGVDSRGTPRVGVGAIMALLLGWPPVLYNLEKGQWSVLLAVLLALAWRAVARGRFRSGAAWAAAAAATKVFPVVLGMYFLFRSVRAFAVFSAVGALLTAVPVMWLGAESLLGFISNSRQNLRYWETFPSVMFSFHGAAARLFTGGDWAEPLVHAPWLTSVVDGAIFMVLGVSAAWVTWRSSPYAPGKTLTLIPWLVLLPLVNPQSLGHNGVLLALPLAVVYSRIRDDARSMRKFVWAAALLLISVPRQLIWTVVEMPVQPLAGIGVIALPMWGTLALFFLSCFVALEANADRTHTPAAHPGAR